MMTVIHRSSSSFSEAGIPSTCCQNIPMTAESCSYIAGDSLKISLLVNTFYDPSQRQVAELRGVEAIFDVTIKGLKDMM